MSLDKPISRATTARASVRQQRIERWTHKGTTDSIHQRPSLSQTDRLLDVNLQRLGEQREKLIERHNYQQKLFINKQAMRYKDNEPIQSTLNYVRKCSQHFDMSTVDEESIDPAKWFEENSSSKLIRRPLSHTSASKSKRPTSVQASQPAINPVADVFLQHNRKHIETIRSATAKKSAAPPQPAKPDDDDDARRHVQFQVTLERNSQSAYVSRKANASSPSSSSSASSDNKQPHRNVTSAHGLRTDPISPTDSAPLLKAVDQTDVQTSPIIRQRRRSPARMIATKSSLREFRQHPERFLSKSNRYLPLLQRQASQSKLHKEKASNSLLANGSDLAYDDARSFLSEELDAGKTICSPPSSSSVDNHAARVKPKLRAPTKIDLMSTTVVDTSEQTAALARLRLREQARLQSIIQTNPIEHIVESLWPIGTAEKAAGPSRGLNEILRSVDSLRCSTSFNTRKRKQSEIDKNIAKLGILIF